MRKALGGQRLWSLIPRIKEENPNLIYGALKNACSSFISHILLSPFSLPSVSSNESFKKM